ncbi:LOW QUALITY PROTEIN: spermatogenesis associated 6-like protein [Spheniscus humboldti]
MAPRRSRVSLLGVPPAAARHGPAAQVPLKAVAELQVQAVTCPGVFLPEKHDVFLSERILGQHKETENLRPVFPLLFHEKMCFEKVFESAIDPAAVTEMLERDDLAFYEENTGDFLFPECKLTPAYPGVDRELLMETSPHFPGIAPKIDLSTRTTITELPLQDRRKNYLSIYGKDADLGVANSLYLFLLRNQSLTQRKTSVKRDKSYGRRTRSLKSQAPSLNTRDCFCELCRENQQQPSRLSLGSAECKSENENTPFVVRHKCCQIQLHVDLGFPGAIAARSDIMEARFLIRQMIKEPSEQATSEQDSSSLATDGSVNYLRYPPSQRDSAFHRVASSATSQHLKSPSPVGSPSAFQNRLLVLNQISYLSDFVLWEHKLNDQKDSLSDFLGKLNSRINFSRKIVTTLQEMLSL